MVVKEKKTKIITGKVISDIMNKSRTVLVVRRITHPLYGKVIERNTKLMVHDEKNESKVGDTVEVTYFRPLSKRKSFRLVRIVKKTETEKEE